MRLVLLNPEEEVEKTRASLTTATIIIDSTAATTAPALKAPARGALEIRRRPPTMNPGYHPGVLCRCLHYEQLGFGLALPGDGGAICLVFMYSIGTFIKSTKQVASHFGSARGRGPAGHSEACVTPNDVGRNP